MMQAQYEQTDETPKSRRFFFFGYCLLFACIAGSATGAHGDEPKKGKQARSDIPKELTPKLFTLQQKDISLKKALAELAKQTGNPVEDRRQVKDETPINVDVKNVTFWQGLETIAKAADARVSVYEKDGKVALIDGPHQSLPISFSGLFRITVNRMDLIRVLDTDTHTCLIFLEVAWEPRFQPLLLETQPDDLVIQDDKGNAVEVPEGPKGPASIAHRLAAQVQLRVGAPRRSAAQLGLLKGKLKIAGPSEMLTFTFDKLRKIENSKDGLKETQAGVTVNIRELRTEGEEGEQIWTVGLLLEYPPGGPSFESFQSWLVNNEICLEKEKAGLKQRFPFNLGYENDEEVENKAAVRYRFGDDPDKNLNLGKLSDWKLVYRTPGKITEIAVPFELKDIPLP
jgi:hypothetical protein